VDYIVGAFVFWHCFGAKMKLAAGVRAPDCQNCERFWCG
jgi:hypothetical protein